MIVEVNHPEINGSTFSSWNDTLYFGRDNYAMWQFESSEELTAGEWVISVKLGNEIIAKKSFFVQIPPKMPGKVTELCEVDDLDLFPQPVQEAHKSCCEDINANACYDFAWRGLERIKDKEGALLYYSESCELGYTSGCRAAAKISENKELQLYFYDLGCDLNDIDSCIEVGRDF